MSIGNIFERCYLCRHVDHIKILKNIDAVFGLPRESFSIIARTRSSDFAISPYKCTHLLFVTRVFVSSASNVRISRLPFFNCATVNNDLSTLTNDLRFSLVGNFALDVQSGNMMWSVSLWRFS
jgi:hypothetical protein